jgi:hypothetical protein
MFTTTCAATKGPKVGGVGQFELERDPPGRTMQKLNLPSWMLPPPLASANGSEGRPAQFVPLMRKSITVTPTGSVRRKAVLRVISAIELCLTR